MICLHCAVVIHYMIPPLTFQRHYKKSAKENFAKFSHIFDRPEILLAKVNAANLSDVSVTHVFCI